LLIFNTRDKPSDGRHVIDVEKGGGALVIRNGEAVQHRRAAQGVQLQRDGKRGVVAVGTRRVDGGRSSEGIRLRSLIELPRAIDLEKG
jgi:hypothetical protein